MGVDGWPEGWPENWKWLYKTIWPAKGSTNEIAYFCKTGELVDMRSNDHRTFEVHHLKKGIHDFTYRISSTRGSRGNILVSGIYQGVKHVEKTIQEWQCITCARIFGQM